MLILMFILSGDPLLGGNVSKSLVGLANILGGHVRGSTALVTRLAHMFFGAISRSDPAVSVAIGAVVTLKTEKERYECAFPATVITASGLLGVLSYKNILMVVLGVVTGTSVGALLVAGVGPALVTALPR